MNRGMDLQREAPLSYNEQKILEKLEKDIEDNIGGFFKVGLALAEIRDRRLYRTQYLTFEEYARKIWDMGKSRVYQYLDATEVLQKVHNCGLLNWEPKNEAQARPLTKIVKSHSDKLPEIIERVLSTSKDGKITASHIKKTVRRYLGEETGKTIEKARKTAGTVRITTGFKAAFEAFLAQIELARENSYKEVDRQIVIAALDEIRNALRIGGGDE